MRRNLNVGSPCELRSRKAMAVSKSEESGVTDQQPK